MKINLSGYPRLMRVWNNGEEVFTKFVQFERDGKFWAYDHGHDEESSKGAFQMTRWDNACNIHPEEPHIDGWEQLQEWVRDFTYTPKEKLSPDEAANALFQRGEINIIQYMEIIKAFEGKLGRVMGEKPEVPTYTIKKLKEIVGHRFNLKI